MRRLTHIEAAILAGGASKRMGRDKATLLAARVAEALGACVARVRIVVRPGQIVPLDLPRIEDAHPERAPIVGVAAALRACEASGVLVAACDLPGLDPRVVLGLLALAPANGGPEIVAPLGPHGAEPLLAIYRPRLLPEVERRIAEGELSLQALLRDADTLLVPADDLRLLDPALRSLHNANTPADL